MTSVVSASALAVEGSRTENGPRRAAAAAAVLPIALGPEKADAIRKPPPRLEKATAADNMTAHFTAELVMEMNWCMLFWISPMN